jgi:hypothetical protein
MVRTWCFFQCHDVLTKFHEKHTHTHMDIKVWLDNFFYTKQQIYTTSGTRSPTLTEVRISSLECPKVAVLENALPVYK